MIDTVTVVQRPKFEYRVESAGESSYCEPSTFAIVHYQVFKYHIVFGTEVYLTEVAWAHRLDDHNNTIRAVKDYKAKHVLSDNTVVVDPDLEVVDFPVPTKVQFILDKLNA